MYIYKLYFSGGFGRDGEEWGLEDIDSIIQKCKSVLESYNSKYLHICFSALTEPALTETQIKESLTNSEPELLAIKNAISNGHHGRINISGHSNNEQQMHKSHHLL